MTSSNGNINRITGSLRGESTDHRWIPSQRQVTRNFGVFIDLSFNKRLRKQSKRWWFETPSRSLWRHCHVCLVLLRLDDDRFYHDDVIKWKHFPRNWPFVRGIHRSPVNSLHKGQWRGTLMFSLICVWINDWVNNGEAGDLRRYRIHYDVTVMTHFLQGNSTGTRYYCTIFSIVAMK